MAVYHVNPGDTLSTIVSGSSAGDTFYIHGTHRLQQCAPKNNQSFIGLEDAKLIGAKIITFTWNGTYWISTGNTQDNGTSSGLDGYANPAHVYKTEELFINDVPLRRVTTLAEIGTGKWYFDYAADTIYLTNANNPTGQTVETTVLTYAFRSNATNVSIQDMTIEKYGCHAKEGAIHSDTGPWLVQNCTVQWNHGAGIRLGLPGNPGSTVRRCTVYQNGQIGLLCSGTGGLIEYTDIRLNNFADFDWFWEAGGTKFANSTNLVVRHCRAANNKGFGLWTDINNSGTLYEYNLCHDNYLDGIFHEISYSAIIRYNVCINNGTRGGAPSMNRAGICVHNSSDVEIHDNYVVGYYLNDSTFGNGIGVWEQSRGSGNQGAWRATDVYVHHNTVVMPGKVRSGVSRNTTISDNNVWSTNTFDSNTYYVDNVSRANFKYSIITDAYVTFATYQAISYAPDDNSTLVTTLPANYAAIPTWTLADGLSQPDANPGILDRNLRHNNLHRRPPGMLRINREHPLSRGLAWYVTPGGNAPHDLISGQPGNLMTSAAWDYVTERGEAVQSSSLTTGGVYWEFPETLANLGTDYTILVMAKPDGLMAYSTLLSIPVAPFSWQTPYIATAFQRHSTTTQGSFAYSNSGTAYAAQSDTGFIQTSDSLTVYSVVREGTTVKFYRNGLQHGTSKTLGANLAPNVSAKQPITLMSHSSTNPDEGLQGYVLVAAIWNRALTDHEILKMAQDPWQMVRTPMVPRFGNVVNPEGVQTTVSFGDVTLANTNAVSLTEGAAAAATISDMTLTASPTVALPNRPIRRFMGNTKFRPNTRLNRAHPLAQGLLWYVAPGGRYIHDFVNGGVGTLIGSASWDYVSEYGYATESTATTGADVASWPFNAGLRSIAKNFTIAVYAQIDAHSTNSHLLCVPRATDWGAQPIALALRRAGGSTDAQALWGDGTNSHSAGVSGAYLVADTTFRLYAVTRNGTAARFYRQGLLFGTATWSSNNDVNAFANEQPINLLGRSTTNTGNGTDGKVIMAAIWDRTLTDEEIYWLQNDPYAPMRQTAPLLVTPNILNPESITVPVAVSDLTLAAGTVTLELGAVADIPAAFGDLTPQGGVVTLSPESVTAPAAISDVTVHPELVTVALTEGINAAATISNVTLVAGTVIIQPESIGQIPSALGNVAFAPGAVTKTLDGIQVAATISDVAIIGTIHPESITVPSAISDITLSPGAVTIQPEGIAVPVAVSDVTTQPGTVTLSLEGIQAAAAFGSITASPGAVNLSLDGIAAPATISNVTFNGAGVIDPDSITAPVAFGTLTLLPGAVTIPLDSVGQIPVVLGDLNTVGEIEPESISAPAAIGDITLGIGTVVLSLDGIAVPATVSNVTAAPQPMTIALEGIAVPNAIGDVTPQGSTAVLALQSVGQIPVTISNFELDVTIPLDSPTAPTAFGNISFVPGHVFLFPLSFRVEPAFGDITFDPEVAVLTLEGIRAAATMGMVAPTTQLPGSANATIRRYGRVTVTIRPTNED